MKKNPKMQRVASRSRSRLSAIYVLIAIVAMIECFVLISFTTYSWIETASSLIIKTGHKNYDDTEDSRIPITNALNYKFVVTAGGGAADLNHYFSYSGQSDTNNLYRFSRASSADGKTFYFQSTGGSTAYRLGDIIDSNSNFTHFDFTVSNKDNEKDHKLKFYFENADVFSVTNDTANLSDAQLNTIKNAMRISFQTGTGTPKIYAMSDGTADVFASTAVSTTSGDASSVSVTKIKADENQKLFTVGKNSEQNISVRIWLEEKSEGLSALTSDQLSGVNISINLQLAYAQNDYDYLYFDDFTFSNNKNNIGGHLTEDNTESDSYRMYFVYQESSGGTNRHVYPMTIDTSGSNVDARCWVTCDSSGSASSTIPDISGQSYITNLTTANSSAALYSYFAYGAWNKSNVGTSTAPSTPRYTWNLNGSVADNAGELRYNAYSVTQSSATTAYGIGDWSYKVPLTMVYFRDRATAVTANAYNMGDNFKYITNAVNAASDTDSGNRNNVMYVNTTSNTDVTATATMFYEKSAENGQGLFKSWIPTAWLADQYINFSYCSGGYYSTTPTVRWSSSGIKASRPAASSNYIYTALGYSETTAITSTANKTGIGCWNAIEETPITFSTELIDNDVTNAFRYQIGVNINDGGMKYYNLIPDATNMSFYAYVPVPGTNTSTKSDYNAGDIEFRSYATAGGSQNGTWYANMRKGSRTYYPVALNMTPANAASPKGHWKISVIVDGTYEHFFWDTRVASDPTDDGVLGTFSYNTTGHAGTNPSYTDITPNVLDEYRWYVPLDGYDSTPEYIYYKWEPYTGTVFTYSQKLTDGIYCVITEASDNTPANAFD